LWCNAIKLKETLQRSILTLVGDLKLEIPCLVGSIKIGVFYLDLSETTMIKTVYPTVKGL